MAISPKYRNMDKHAFGDEERRGVEGGEDGIVGIVGGDGDWRGWCCIFIINSISREDHLSVGGSRPSY